MKLDMGLAEDCEKLKVNLRGKMSNCKYCECISWGVFGGHYACANKNSKSFLMSPPVCSKECDGYESDYGYGADD